MLRCVHNPNWRSQVVDSDAKFSARTRIAICSLTWVLIPWQSLRLDIWWCRSSPGWLLFRWQSRWWRASTGINVRCEPCLRARRSWPAGCCPRWRSNWWREATRRTARSSGGTPTTRRRPRPPSPARRPRRPACPRPRRRCCRDGAPLPRVSSLSDGFPQVDPRKTSACASLSQGGWQGRCIAF